LPRKKIPSRTFEEWTDEEVQASFGLSREEILPFLTEADKHNLLRKHGNWWRGELRRRMFLQAMQDGLSLDAGCARVGWTRHGYNRSRDRHPDWAFKVDSIRGHPIARAGPGFRGDFQGFRKTYFGHDSPWFHLKVVEALEEGEPGSITLILLPPEHGKTSLLEDYCNFKLAVDPTFRIVIGSEGQPHSRKVLRRVRSRMEEHGPAPNYVLRFGPFAPQTGEKDRKSRQPWGADFFDVFKKDEHDERDYSMVGLGWRSAIAGTRTDLLVMDDVQSRKSLNLTDEMFETFRQDWLSRPGSHGRTVIIGTRVGPADFYERLIEAEMVDRLITIPAYDNYGNWLWPERYSPEEYQRMRRNVGEDAWWRNYMQQPRHQGDATFLNEYIDKCKVPLRTLGMIPDVDGHMVLSLDPALGGGNALTACHFGRRLAVVDQIQDTNLARMEQILDRILDFTLRYRPTTLIVESNAFQRGLARDDRLLSMGNAYGFRIVEHQTGQNKRDEIFGVASMAQDFARELVELPWADEKITRARIEPLIAELQAWRPDVPTRRIRQDRVMSLWFAWLRWRRSLVTKTTTAQPIRVAGSPFRKTPGGRVLTQAGTNRSVW
jgi:hypothetical protein